MKKPSLKNANKKAVITIVALLIMIAGAVGVSAATSDPGSDSDPVVTKSYVDKAISDALSSVSTGGDAVSYEVVQVAANKKVIATGATEMILRSGEAVAIDNGSNGVSDMTSGTDLMSNYTVKQNHLLLIPRDDGRGIQTKTDCYVMIRGSYEIQ